MKNMIDHGILIYEGPSTNKNNNLGVFKNTLPQNNDTQVGSNLFSKQVDENHA